MPQQMRGMPSPIQASKSPAKTYQLTHAVTTNKAGAGGALQGSWDVPSAHSYESHARRDSTSSSLPCAKAPGSSVERLDFEGANQVVYRLPAAGADAAAAGAA